MEKTNIDKRYPEEIEAGREDAAYRDFLQVMSSTFNLLSVSSLIDVGCSGGNLIKLIKQSHQHIDVAGIEYFEYHKKYADPSILDKINFIDIRDPLPENLRNRKFDIVICTEVGEHIDPDFCDTFLQNIKSLTGKYLIMTWSSHGGINEPQFDPYHQHLNPLPLDRFLSLMDSKGFELNIQASNQLFSSSTQFINFFPWWRESLTVWTVK